MSINNQYKIIILAESDIQKNIYTFHIKKNIQILNSLFVRALYYWLPGQFLFETYLTSCAKQIIHTYVMLINQLQTMAIIHNICNYKNHIALQSCVLLQAFVIW